MELQPLLQREESRDARGSIAITLLRERERPSATSAYTPTIGPCFISTKYAAAGQKFAG